ncbi:MAG: FtsW/RodA/SpoVE family cell cycle protein [Bacilli bacterium]|nr:FtsW/RodA/SpoVE family cell cycle protein [Bacilli bacterium]
MKRIKKILNDMDKPLLALTIFMIGYGLLNIVTASSREAISQDVTLYHYFYKQSQMLFIGFIGSFFFLLYNTKNYDKWALLAFVGIFLVLVYLYISGDSHRGSINWISVGGIRFQPSEFAKPVMIVCTSILFEKFYRKLRTKDITHYDLIGIILAVGCIFPLIVIMQKDLGTGMILLGTFGVMFLASPILKLEKFRTILTLGLVCVFSVLILAVSGKKLLTEEQLDRFNFINPCSNYEEGGYQVCNGMIAINDGGLFGLGIGKSKQKYSYIPEPHTDSVFSIIMEEYGLLFSSVLLLFYVLILYRIFMIASKASTIRGRFICLGVGTYMFFHILFNLGGLFAVLPLTGVPLPFLSYGGSFTISLICSLAIVQRVNIETKNQKIKV